MNVIVLKESCFNQNSAIITKANIITHIQNVLKPSVGDWLKIAKINGLMGVGKVQHLTDESVVLSDVCLDQLPPPKLDVTVILALPRPKVLRRLMIDMTAMGVDHIVLLNSYRTDKSYWGSPLLQRLDEFVIEGLSQGVDSVPPKITLAKRFKPFVQDELPSLMAGQAVVFHPYATQTFTDSMAINIKTELPKVVIIGAEGGFIPYEIDLLGSVGVLSVSLGKRILRTESAVSAVLGHWLG
ncbi:16S rRNA (uracil(1498)-N(3))-methyltransferase [Moraxella nasovis]|uniref:16S rRNA (uracil(1498)-N(3))-methyltransferase n=1 Tax=Moraxella nasovis TaxID=2904121 RepID=UPI001F6195FA|nr:16S rRNA (uracil(1498)-N(3))-methyltransferase [Moraxella nasovis]UNU73679.1 16S rRNA (uracil(1498)-N(3))-methyltransferase [Moraxella nasovis]